MIVVIRNPNRKVLKDLLRSESVPDARHFGAVESRGSDVALVDMRE